MVRHRNKPKQNANKPFRVLIDLDAVMDYMTMLRGMTAHGNFYEDFISDELTRYPSFDGTDWEGLLPDGITFQTFLEDAINGNNKRQRELFDSVRPYDFAHRELSFIHRKDAEIVIQVPPLFHDHIPAVDDWFQKLLPTRNKYIPVQVVLEDHSNEPDFADLWVVRNPSTTKWLTDNGRPFILIDGKENQNIDDTVRVIRWDQAGFLIRHGQLMDYLTKNYPISRPVASRPEAPLYPPHRDVWNGNPVVLLPLDDSVRWVGDQIRSLELVSQDPGRRLRYRPEHGQPRHKARPYSPELVEKVLEINQIDLEELTRKRDILFSLSQQKFQGIYDNPGWTGTLRSRNEKMGFVLSDLEKELGLDPVSGRQTKKKDPNIPTAKNAGNFGARLINGKPTDPVMFNRSLSEGIRLFASNWEVVRLEEYHGDKDNIAGHLAELATLLLLKEEGWKLLVPKGRNGKSDSSLSSLLQRPKFMRMLGQEVDRVSEFARIDLSWNDLSTKELRTAEVDFVARGPERFLVIGEVKLTSNTELSDSQVALRSHIMNGGRVLNPGFPGIRTKSFVANWREIHVDDGPLNRITPNTTFDQIEPRQGREIS